MGNDQSSNCNATFDTEISVKDPAYKELDAYYSNQGKGSTCTRQAVAKAVYSKIRLVLGTMHPMELKILVSFLVGAIPKGSSSSSPRDYDGLIGQFSCES